MTEDITKEMYEMINTGIRMSKELNLDTMEDIEKHVNDIVREKGFNSIPEYLKHHDNDSQ